MSEIKLGDFLPKLQPVHHYRRFGRKRMTTVVKYTSIVLIPVTIGVGVYGVVKAVQKDMRYETSRNTSKALSGIAFTWTGGIIGAAVGTVIGKSADEINGTAIGGLVGGIIGAIGLSLTMGLIFESVGDAASYNIVRRTCLTCSVPFIIRVYEGWTRSDRLCKRCYYIELYRMFMFSMH